jgi:CubicO group peptidase (beta-lactamase class C family)
VLGWQSYDNAAAAGSLISSAAEMANWLILHVEEGCFRSRQILRRDSVKELHAIQNSRTDPSRPLGAGMHPDAEAAEGYAMGWHRGTYCGRLHLYHSGGILGFPAYAAFMPGQKFGVVALANGPRSVRDDYAFNKAIAFWIFDRLLGEPETDWSRQYLSWMQKVRNAAEGEEAELQRTRVSSAPPSRALQEYAGVYEDCAGQSGPVVVDVREGDLALSFAGAGAYSALLEHWHYDLFRMRSNPVADEVFDKENMYGRFVCFSTDPKGKRIMRAFGGEFRQQGD